MNQVMTIEVADFVEAVDAALADLSPAVRAELLEDLPAHLRDVLADGGAPRDVLGEPGAYAAELRAAAGLATADARRARRGSLDRLRTADAEAGALLGYSRLTDLIRSLQPAWWLLRAYLAVQLLTGVQARHGGDALVPRIGHSVGLGALGVLAACAFSVWLGRRPARSWTLAVSTIATLVLLGVGAVTVQSVYTVDSTNVQIGDQGYTDPVSSYGNLYPVGPDGKVIHDVRLYDQDGQPVVVDSACPTDGNVDPNQQDPPQLFPVVCPGADGSLPTDATPGPLPSAVSSAPSSTSTTPAVATSPAPTPSR